MLKRQCQDPRKLEGREVARRLKRDTRRKYASAAELWWSVVILIGCVFCLAGMAGWLRGGWR